MVRILFSLLFFAAGVAMASPRACLDQFAQLENRIEQSLLATASPPTGVSVKAVTLRPLDQEAVRQLKAGNVLHYVTDSNGGLFLTESMESPPADNLLLLRSPGEDENGFHLVQEAGELRLGSDGKVALTTPYSLVSGEAIDADGAVNDALQAHGDLSLASTRVAQNAKTTVLRCAEVLASHTSFKRVVLDQLIANNLVLASAVLTGELSGAHRLSSEDGRQVLTVDAVGNNVGSVAAAVLGKTLVTTNAPLPVAFAARIGLGLGMIQLNKQMYGHYLKHDSQKRSDKIAEFDTVHFLIRIPVNQAIDKFIMSSLPSMLFDACKRDSKLTIFISPRSVRIAERFASTYLYYEARKEIINE